MAKMTMTAGGCIMKEKIKKVVIFIIISIVTGLIEYSILMPKFYSINLVNVTHGGLMTCILFAIPYYSKEFDLKEKIWLIILSQFLLLISVVIYIFYLFKDGLSLSFYG
jgi:high-affinity Fe2+/Pb2+ permease